MARTVSENCGESFPTTLTLLSHSSTGDEQDLCGSTCSLPRDHQAGTFQAGLMIGKPNVLEFEEVPP